MKTTFLLSLLLVETISLSLVHFSSTEDLSSIVKASLEGAKDVLVVAYSVDPTYLGLTEKARIATETFTSNAFVHVSPGLLHAKFMVLDGEVVIFGSANFNQKALEEDLNNLFVVRSKEIASFFEEIYEWVVLGKKPRTRLKTFLGEFFLVPFEDGEKIFVETLLRARRYVLICCYAFTDEDVFATLKYLSSKGVKVFLLLDEWLESSRIYGLPMRDFEVFVVREPLLHHKFMVVDGKELICGSANFTESGFHRNVELILRTRRKDIVKAFVEEFERLWRGYLVQGVRF